MDQSYHDLLAAGVEKRFRDLEMAIMDDIIRRIRKAGTITDSADWQIQRLIILGNSTQDIEDLIRKAVDGNEEEVRRLYAEVIEREYTRDRSLYEQIGKEFIPYEQNPELQQLTDALVHQSSEELYNITRSTGFMLDNGHGGKVFTPLADVYNGYLDDAITGMANGAYDYNTLVRRMVSQMTASGLRTDHPFSDGGSDYGVDYASGWHNRVDVAARRALLTGFGQLTGHVTDLNAQRLGTDYFEVTWHAGARPDHAAWQGKVYTKEQLTTKCGLGTGPGLLGWNCRHTYYPFIPGVSERLYTDEWLEEQNARETLRAASVARSTPPTRPLRSRGRWKQLCGPGVSRCSSFVLEGPTRKTSPSPGASTRPSWSSTAASRRRWAWRSRRSASTRDAPRAEFHRARRSTRNGRPSRQPKRPTVRKNAPRSNAERPRTQLRREQAHDPDKRQGHRDHRLRARTAAPWGVSRT